MRKSNAFEIEPEEYLDKAMSYHYWTCDLDKSAIVATNFGELQLILVNSFLFDKKIKCLLYEINLKRSLIFILTNS